MDCQSTRSASTYGHFYPSQSLVKASKFTQQLSLNHNIAFVTWLGLFLRKHSTQYRFAKLLGNWLSKVAIDAPVRMIATPPKLAPEVIDAFYR